MNIIYVPFLLEEKSKNFLISDFLTKPTIIANGLLKTKIAVSFDTDTFIHYINTYHLMDNDEKAYLIDKELQSIPNTCNTTLFF